MIGPPVRVELALGFGLGFVTDTGIGRIIRKSSKYSGDHHRRRLVVSGTIIFLWTARLACWPFEVEGQGLEQTEPTAETPSVIEADKSRAPATLPAKPVPPPLPRVLPVPPTLPLFEEARYDVRYGIFGSVGELKFSVRGVASAPDGSRFVPLRGSGEGAVLGLGSIRRGIDADFDPLALGSFRWTVRRHRSGEPPAAGIVDRVTRDGGGALLLERLTPGQPPSRQKLTFAIPTSDALGLLWRLRTAPPPAGRTETLQLLDGLALWRIRVTTALAREILPDADAPAIRLDGELAPIFYDGLPDPDRPTRRFTLWLSEKGNHLPLRLEVPIGPADVVMTLIEARHLGPAPSADQLIGPVPGARIL
jgi:hypothetical protein